MLTALKWLFYLIAAVALIVVGGSFLLPSSVVVTRSIDIAAPPDKVFAIVGDPGASTNSRRGPIPIPTSNTPTRALKAASAS
jgi:hypothetical protein